MVINDTYSRYPIASVSAEQAATMQKEKFEMFDIPEIDII